MQLRFVSCSGIKTSFLLIFTEKGSSNSYAIKKKDELERVAKSNR